MRVIPGSPTTAKVTNLWQELNLSHRYDRIREFFFLLSRTLMKEEYTLPESDLYSSITSGGDHRQATAADDLLCW